MGLQGKFLTKMAGNEYAQEEHGVELPAEREGVLLQDDPAVDLQGHEGVPQHDAHLRVCMCMCTCGWWVDGCDLWKGWTTFFLFVGEK